MKHSELVSLFLESRIPADDFVILQSYYSSQLYFIKLKHSSGRICFTWSDISPSSRTSLRLRSITPKAQNESIMQGSYTLVVPSCDGIVGEFSNRIDIFSINGGSISKPEKISLLDDASEAPYKHPTIYPLVSLDNLKEDSWKRRYDELMRASCNDLILTMNKRLTSVQQIAHIFSDVIKNTSNNLSASNTTLMISSDPEEIKKSTQDINLTLMTLRSLDSLSYKLNPLLEMLKLRSNNH